MAVEPEPDIQTCPKCGAHGEHPPAVRQGVADWHGVSIGIIDFGWRCFDCKHEWGFEIP